MSTSTLDPMIHDPERLRITATLAALPPGDGLSFTRLQDMLGLTAVRLSARLRQLDQAGYIRMANAGGGGIPNAAALTPGGRSALDHYAAALRQPPPPPRAPASAQDPTLRVGDADREAAAAALCEHFAQGRLSLEELHTRLDAALTATTYGDLTEAVQDLAD